MQRYELVHEHDEEGCALMSPDTYGAWVRYADVQTEIERLTRERDEARNHTPHHYVHEAMLVEWRARALAAEKLVAEVRASAIALGWDDSNSLSPLTWLVQRARRVADGLRRKIDALTAERHHDALDGQAALDEANAKIEALEADLAAQTYRGNSVAYWASKADCYSGIIGEVHAAIGFPGVDIRETARDVAKRIPDLEAKIAELEAEVAALKPSHAADICAQRRYTGPIEKGMKFQWIVSGELRERLVVLEVANRWGRDEICSAHPDGTAVEWNDSEYFRKFANRDDGPGIDSTTLEATRRLMPGSCATGRADVPIPADAAQALRRARGEKP